MCSSSSRRYSATSAASSWGRIMPRAVREGRDSASFVKITPSRSSRGIVRGLHLQRPHDQGKLVSVLEAKSSMSRWMRESARRASGVGWVPSSSSLNHLNCTSRSVLLTGLCHQRLRDVHIQVPDFYHPEYELGIAFDDPDIGIRWPVDQPILGAKDQRSPPLARIDPEKLPRYPSALG
jgi:dTDP-4-dehydrorhamnose 3,5-epimerase